MTRPPTPSLRRDEHSRALGGDDPNKLHEFTSNTGPRHGEGAPASLAIPSLMFLLWGIPLHAFGATKPDVVVSTKTIRPIISFQANAGCSGFDSNEPDTPAMMVPKTGSTLARAVLRQDQAFAIPHIELRSQDRTIADISPKNLNAISTLVSVSGTAVDDTFVEARPKGGTYVYDDAYVTVKDRVSLSLAIHAITEENDDVPVLQPGQGTAGSICVTVGLNGFRDTKPVAPDAVGADESIVAGTGGCHTPANAAPLAPTAVPSAAALQTYLNSIWGTQANIYFDTVTRLDKTLNYDLDRDGVLGPSLGGERLLITQQAKTANVLNVYFVANMGGSVGYTVGQEMWVQSPVPGGDSPLNTTAHEVGHALEIPGEDHSTNPIHLMYEFDASGANPCQLRLTDWEFANP